MAYRFLFALIAVLLPCSLLLAETKPFVEKFEETSRPKKWGVNFGYWEPEAGHLVARQLKKKGHLFSLNITPTTATIKKHHDKADKKSKEAILATASVKLQKDEWIAVRMQTIGNQVSVQVGKNIKLEASDDSFHVKKPTVVFRVGGGDIHIDDLVLIKK
jgi:hypothetical protein